MQEGATEGGSRDLVVARRQLQLQVEQEDPAPSVAKSKVWSEAEKKALVE